MNLINTLKSYLFLFFYAGVFLYNAKLEILRMSVGKLFQIHGPTHLIENTGICSISTAA